MESGLVLWGGKGLARSVKDCVDRLGLEILAVVDNDAVPPPFRGVPLLRGEAALDAWLGDGHAESIGFAVCIGREGNDRLSIFELMTRKRLAPRAIVHPSAFVADPSLVEPGAIILANATIGVDVRVGEGAIVNQGANVNPGSSVGRGAHIAPGVNLAGEVTVRESAFVGIGATVLPRIVIGRGAVVGAGSVVTKDVADGATVVGCPARPIY